MNPRLILGGRWQTYRIIALVTAMVCLYGILHDQLVVTIAPEHFTIYHDPLLGIEDPRMLAFAYAYFATVGPGIILGILVAYATQDDSDHQRRARRAMRGVGLVLLAVGILSAAMGGVAWAMDRPVYPADWYPEKSGRLLVTQTVQLTAYLVAGLGSVILLVKLRARDQSESGRTFR